MTRVFMCQTTLPRWHRKVYEKQELAYYGILAADSIKTLPLEKKYLNSFYLEKLLNTGLN